MLNKLIKQNRRLTAIRSCLLALERLDPVLAELAKRKLQLRFEIRGNIQAYLRAYNDGDPAPDICPALREYTDRPTLNYFSLTRAINEYNNSFDRLRQCCRK